ncbi:MAG: hypothetical protein GTN80_04290 [Nitrososphaeria archaeon]|nr:hypothetical protein [Nitrososphaeria archaeon]NIQ32849.1 hypothetical protein [Nitrososphaeria archaeon]
MKLVVDEVVDTLVNGEPYVSSDLAKILNLREEKIKEILKFLTEFEFVKIINNKVRIDPDLRKVL